MKILVKIKAIIRKILKKMYTRAINNILTVSPGIGKITEEETKELLKSVDELD